jgi:putative membrane protein
MTEIIQPAFESSAFSILITSVLAAIALIYWCAWHRLSDGRRPRIPGWRLGAFMGGLLAVWAAVASPLALLDHRLLTMHMVQHLLLMTVAPLLLLLGEPRFCLERGLPAFARPLAGGFGQTSIERLTRFLANPRFCLLAATAVLLTWHLPAIFDVAMRSPAWHRVEVANFLLGGILFWLPVTQPWTTSARSHQWWIPLYLFLATLPCDVLSAFLTFCDRVIYRCYTDGPRPIPISALQDQEYAGALMWTCVTFAYLIPAVIVTVALLSQFDDNPLSGIAGTPLQSGDGWQIEPSRPIPRKRFRDIPTPEDSVGYVSSIPSMVESPYPAISDGLDSTGRIP